LIFHGTSLSQGGCHPLTSPIRKFLRTFSDAPAETTRQPEANAAAPLSAFHDEFTCLDGGATAGVIKRVRLLKLIVTFVFASVIACGVSFASSILGVILFYALIPDSVTIPETTGNFLGGVLFAGVGFAGVVSGSLRLPHHVRRIGSILLLILGLCFYSYLWVSFSALDNHTSEFPHFLPLAVGGALACLFFMLRPANRQALLTPTPHPPA
jgi:hypothetical protein